MKAPQMQQRATVRPCSTASLRSRPASTPPARASKRRCSAVVALGVVEVGPTASPLSVCSEPRRTSGTVSTPRARHAGGRPCIRRVSEGQQIREQVGARRSFKNPSTEIVEREEKEDKKEPTWSTRCSPYGAASSKAP